MSQFMQPAKIQWSKREYGEDQDPMWGTSTRPPEPLDAPKQSTCKSDYVKGRVKCNVMFMMFISVQNPEHVS